MSLSKCQIFSSIPVLYELRVEEAVLINLKYSFQAGRKLHQYKLKSGHGTGTLRCWKAIEKTSFDQQDLTTSTPPPNQFYITSLC